VRTVIPAAPLPAVDARPRRVLVVVDEPCASRAFCATVLRHGSAGALEALVVAPARDSPATQWYADEEAARADATQRLRECIACLAASGVRACGRLADPDPLQAVGDALREFPADAVLVVTRPLRPSTWLQANLVDRVRRSFDLPVEHVVVEASDRRR